MTNSDKSVIRHTMSTHVDTFGVAPMPGMEDCVTTPALINRTAEDHHLRGAAQRYGSPMTADTIAAALREQVMQRTPYLPDRKLHALLYLTQGLAYAAGDKPLFDADITATTTGVHVDGVTPGAAPDLTPEVLLVAARYGQLSAMDLEALIRGQQPWQQTTAGQVIDPELIRRQFQEQEDIPEGTVSGHPRSTRAALHRPTVTSPATPDSPEEIAAFIADTKARM